jgi:hypothetical protein
MAQMGWLKIQRKDVVPFVVAGFIGYFAGRLVPDHNWAVYTSILVSYHLFLAWLVFTGDNKAGVSLGVVSTICTHTACLFLAIAVTMARHYIPFFGILRFGVSSIAVFETMWLFSGAKPKAKAEEAEPAPAKTAGEAQPAQASAIATATGQDHEDWLRYLASRNPTHRRAGISMSQEYEQWLRARIKNRTAQQAAAQ